MSMSITQAMDYVRKSLAGGTVLTDMKMEAMETIAVALAAKAPVAADAYVNGWMEARDYYGYHEFDTEVSHGAECQKTGNDTYVCSCTPEKERKTAVDNAARLR